MAVDPLIVLGQIFNFLLLVWLLHRFLYRPIVHVIVERERAIRARIEQAEALRAQAESEIAAYRQKRAELESTRERFLKEAKAEADRTLKELLAKAAAEGEAARKRYADQLAAEARALESSIQQALTERVYRTSATVLKELAGRSVADGIIDMFERNLAAAQHAGTPVQLNPPVVVRLSFTPNEEQLRRLQLLLQHANPTLNEDDIQFFHDESLLLGIEVESAGTITTWNARDYIKALQEEALRHMQQLAATVGNEARHHV